MLRTLTLTRITKYLVWSTEYVYYVYVYSVQFTDAT